MEMVLSEKTAKPVTAVQDCAATIVKQAGNAEGLQHFSICKHDTTQYFYGEPRSISLSARGNKTRYLSIEVEQFRVGFVVTKPGNSCQNMIISEP